MPIESTYSSGTVHRRVLVFGASGAVGSHTARFAQEQGGAQVFLGLRDVNKSLPPFLTKDQFPRFQADLNDHNAVARAVAESQATAAFVYVVFGSPDGMKQTFQTLKDGGVEHVVLLSSASIPVGQDLASIPASSYVTYQHARVEQALRAVYGPYRATAVRPGMFATNTFAWKASIVAKGEVATAYPDAPQAFITPNDLGDVCGAVLVREPAPPTGAGGEASGSLPSVIPLEGSEVLSLRQAIGIVANALGRPIQVKELTESEHIAQHPHIPRPILENVLEYWRERSNQPSSVNALLEASKNIPIYAGHPPTPLAQFVKDHKQEYMG